MEEELKSGERCSTNPFMEETSINVIIVNEKWNKNKNKNLKKN